MQLSRFMRYILGKVHLKITLFPSIYISIPKTHWLVIYIFFLVIKSEWMFLAINNMKYQLSRILFHQYFMSLFWAVICVSDTVWFWNHALFFNCKATGWFCLGLLPIRDDNAKFNDIFFKTNAVEIESPDFWYKN